MASPHLIITALLCILINTATSDNDSLNQVHLESLLPHAEYLRNNGSRYSPHVTHETRGLKDGHLSLMDHDLKYCQRPAKCQVLNYSTCMGTKLPYHSSTLELTDLTTQELVQEKLSLYKYLKYIPKCWAVIQPFLCALYMPKCEDDMVDLPSREMCKVTLGPCKVLYNTTIFPEFMRCDDGGLFPSRCRNHVHELKFNTTGFCLDPLVKTDQEEWFYPDVDGCGLRCRDALYTENEQYQIHKLVGYCILICITLNFFTVMTFVIDWKTANKYPALAIFYVNLCFLISYTGWMIQFLGFDTRDDVVCKKDGTRRMSEPSASENLSCVIVFVMVYYFLIAGLVWLVIFAYSWYMNSLNALGKLRKRIDKKRAYFHLVAWSVPLMLTITTMALGEIDGDYVSGICFVGFVHFGARTGLLLAPLTVAIMLSGFVITRGLVLLIGVRRKGREVISKKNSQKIHSNVVRMGVFALFMLGFCVITFFYHGYRHMNIHIWERSLYNFILCKLTSLSSDFGHCRQEARPSVAMLQLQLLAVFGAGVAMASWVWCQATVHAWTRYIRMKLDCEEKCPVKLQEHVVVRDAYNKRHGFLFRGEQLSLERHHTDPVGLHFSMNGVESHELSTSWAANLRRLLKRRNALPKLMDTATDTSGNSVSVDSEMSYQVRHVSIESRRNSGDSQLSVQVSKFMLNSRKRRRGKHGYKSKSRRHSHHTTNTNTNHRRGSSTSLDSHSHQQLQQIILAAISSNGRNRTFSTASTQQQQQQQQQAAQTAASGAPGPTQACNDAHTEHGPCHNVHTNSSVKRLLERRRPGDAGLEDGPSSIQSLLRDLCVLGDGTRSTKGKGKGRLSGSEDENVSVTISESRFNVKIGHGANMDLNDELTLDGLRRRVESNLQTNCTNNNNDDDDDDEDMSESDGPQIEELNTNNEDTKSIELHNNLDLEMAELKPNQSNKSTLVQDEYALAKAALNNKRYNKGKGRGYKANISEDDSDYSDSSSSCCRELDQLIVHSSVNSGNSEKHNNRGSKQSKTSIDVAVQANAKDILTQTGNYDVTDAVDDNLEVLNNNGKSSSWSTKRSNEEQLSRDWSVKSKRSKDSRKYKDTHEDAACEAMLNGSDKVDKKSPKGDTESLLKDKYKTKIVKQNGKGLY